MLREADRTVDWKTEVEPYLRTDVVVAGAGVMGLLLAKKLGDLGQRVALLERGPTIATAASIKNHGWLHRGTAHAVSIKDRLEAKRVVNKLMWGHEYFKSYAPEAIEEPFEPMFALTQDADLAVHAQEKWSQLGVSYESIPKEEFLKMDPSIRGDLPLHIFQTQDLRINTRLLYKKLLTDIRQNGGIVLTDAAFEYEKEDVLNVSFHEERIQVKADMFVYATGSQIGDEYRRLTGNPLGVTFWKSHLLYLPRFNPYSIISLDHDQPIIINHKNVSVINRAYDEVASDIPDLTIDEEEVERSFISLSRLYPGVGDIRHQLQSIVCTKPSIRTNGEQRHSVASQYFEPVPNHYFVLPGKMTEAPYVADELIRDIGDKLDLVDITKRPIDTYMPRLRPTFPSSALE